MSLPPPTGRKPRWFPPVSHTSHPCRIASFVSVRISSRAGPCRPAHRVRCESGLRPAIVVVLPVGPRWQAAEGQGDRSGREHGDSGILREGGSHVVEAQEAGCFVALLGLSIEKDCNGR